MIDNIFAGVLVLIVLPMATYILYQAATGNLKAILFICILLSIKYIDMIWITRKTQLFYTFLEGLVGKYPF